MQQLMDFFDEAAPGSGEGEYGADFEALEELKEVSVRAHEAALYAGMAGCSFKKLIIPFVRKVLDAAKRAGEKSVSLGKDKADIQIAARKAADAVCSDCGDPATREISEAAYRVGHEIHKMLGFLRFAPVPYGSPPVKMYEARCAPDNFILPCLEEHFTLRFGETPWAIIDEKRRLKLIRLPGRDVRLEALGNIDAEYKKYALNSNPPETDQGEPDRIEDLWKLYHCSIVIDNRKNLKLQRQFVPLRYREYMPEFRK